MIDRDNDRPHVAWDIETTGFAWNDQITVSGFWFPSGRAELILNTDDTLDSSQFKQKLQQVGDGLNVSVTVATDEAALLETMRQLLFEKFDRNFNRLVAFNAESWKSGFDLPFIRTRCIKHNTDWMFKGIQFADLWDPLKKRLNTTHVEHGGSIEINSLTGAHELLFNHAADALPSSNEDPEQPPPLYKETPYDPFSDSGSAVYCYEQGEYLPILQHNLADVHRTWELGELVREFVSPKDITTKKL